MSQIKNRVDLKEVSDKFTEEVLRDILRKEYNGKKVQLTDWDFGDGFAKGDSYLSAVYKGKLYGIIDDDSQQHVQVNFVVKSMPKNIGRRKTFRTAEFFRNEAIFYTQIIPKFEKFLAGKGQSDLLCIPHHFVSYTDGENDFTVLKDASPLGFGPASRQNCVDWEECKVILKVLAKFHAISFAYRDQKKEEFTQLASCLTETYFADHNWNWYKNFQKKLIDVSKHALATEYPNSKAEKQFNSYKFGELFKMCTDCCNKNDGVAVICGGDCWAPNFLVRDIGQNQKEALLLDFQLARYSNPITDLSLLVYSCTLKSFREQYFDDILKTYYSELSTAIKSLGSDPKKIYPWDLFMKDVKEYSLFGVIFSIEAVPFCLLDPSEAFDLDEIIKNDEAMDISDVFSISNIKTSTGRQRLADVIVEAVERGFL